LDDQEKLGDAFSCDRSGRTTDPSIVNGSQLAVAAPLHIVLDLRGQGDEIALAAVIDKNDEPI
jgi:hypothetical protein